MRTLAREKVNEKNMITNYDAHGFMVVAEELPKACTACPFWLVEAEKFEEGECFLTGHIIKTDGSHDEKRMDDCPIIQRKKKRKAKRMGSTSGMGAELHERKIPGGSNERRH